MATTTDSAQALDRFYEVLNDLRCRLGGHRRLRDCDARSGWPVQGVYFFFEEGESRADGVTPRVVRVGTHAVASGSRRTLWNRLKQHKGRGRAGDVGPGNHRGSVFRRHLGQALLQAGQARVDVRETWGRGNVTTRALREAERALELQVSERICAMPVLWVDVPGLAGPQSARARLERNAIGLLSTVGRLDTPSASWLGRHSPTCQIRESGLWNVDHVGGTWDAGFIDELEHFAGRMGAGR